LRTDLDIGGCRRRCQLDVPVQAYLSLVDAHLPLGTSADTLYEIPTYVRLDDVDTLCVMRAVGNSVVMDCEPSGRQWHLTIGGVPPASQWVSVGIDSGWCGGDRLRFVVETEDSVYYGYGAIGVDPSGMCVDRPEQCSDPLSSCCECVGEELSGFASELYDLLVAMKDLPFASGQHRYQTFSDATPGVWLPGYLGSHYNYQFNGYVWGSVGAIGVSVHCCIWHK